MTLWPIREVFQCTSIQNAISNQSRSEVPTRSLTVNHNIMIRIAKGKRQV